jgi:hypothetical protein
MTIQILRMFALLGWQALWGARAYPSFSLSPPPFPLLSSFIKVYALYEKCQVHSSGSTPLKILLSFLW